MNQTECESLIMFCREINIERSKKSASTEVQVSFKLFKCTYIFYKSDFGGAQL